MKRFIAVATACALAGCSSTTRISVSDPDARILVNGEYIGTGHGTYRDRKPAFSRQDVVLRKDGCREQTYTMRRNERPDIGAIIGAYFLYVPVFWVTRYRNSHEYGFDCLNADGVVVAASE